MVRNDLQHLKTVRVETKAVLYEQNKKGRLDIFSKI